MNGEQFRESRQRGIGWDLFWGVMLAAAYAGLVRVGLFWSVRQGMGSPIFPAAGLALAGLLVFGVRLWPAIVVGRWVVFLLLPSGLPWWGPLLVSLGTAGSAVAGALLLTRVVRIDLALTRLRDVLYLISIGGALTPIVGTAVATGVGLMVGHSAEGILVTGATWWAGNLMGVLLVTPLVLSWAFGERVSRRWQTWTHLAVALVVASGISGYIFCTMPASAAEAKLTSLNSIFRIWLILPAVLWASMIMGVRGATVAGFLVSVIAVIGTTSGHGTFRGFLDPMMRMVTLQQYVATTMATALVMAVVTDERKGKAAISAALADLRGAHAELEKAHGRIGESDARFRQIAEGISHIFWICNLEGRMLYASPAAERLFGVPVETWYRTVGAWAGRVLEEDRARAVGAWVDWLKDPNRAFVNNYRVVAADGSVRWLTERAQVVDAGNGQRRVAGISEDITARQIAEMERGRLEVERERSLTGERAARVELERANRVKDEFLATLSHELRTPLNAIVGWSQLLLASPGELTTVKEGLEVIERNAEAQAHLIEDLLDMSRIASGKVRLEFKDVGAVGLMRGTLDAVRTMAAGKGVALAEELPAYECFVHGDAGRLRQVLTNLLTNAVKFTPASGRVRVRVECGTQWVRWVVEDTGQGIAEEFLPHVFERFRQADASTTRRHGGLGLGLAIVKQLVDLHGGVVTAESAGVGKGARFSVELPRVVGKSEAAERSGGPTVVIQTRALEGLRVLAVDDEPDSLRLVERLLGTWGAQVTTAASGLLALDLLQTTPFDVLLSDVGMAEMDGYELIRRVRGAAGTPNGKIRAVALTAFVREEDKRAARAAGFDEHVSKPVDPGELVRVVKGG